MQIMRLHQCFINFKDCIVTFPCPSSKVSSMHPYIQARRLHQRFRIFKLKGFIDASSYSRSNASSMLPHIQARSFHPCFLIFKFEGFVFLKLKKIHRCFVKHKLEGFIDVVFLIFML